MCYQSSKCTDFPFKNFRRIVMSLKLRSKSLSPDVPIAVLRGGDIVDMNIPARSLNAGVSDFSRYSFTFLPFKAQ